MSVPPAPAASPEPPSPLPQRLPARGSGASTAAGEGSLDDIAALMDYLRREDPPGA